MSLSILRREHHIIRFYPSCISQIYLVTESDHGIHMEGKCWPSKPLYYIVLVYIIGKNVILYSFVAVLSVLLLFDILKKIATNPYFSLSSIITLRANKIIRKK